LGLLVACSGPDQALTGAIGQDVQRFEDNLNHFVESLNYLESTRDSLNQRFLGSLTPSGQRAFLQDTANLRLYAALQNEAQNSLNLYRAFLTEYRLSLEEFRLWHQNLGESGASDEAIREQWRRYVKQFEADQQTEVQIMRHVRDWEETYRRNIFNFGTQYNYLEPPRRPNR
jgi:hypothetical protein